MKLSTVVQKLKQQHFVETVVQFGSSLEREDYRDVDLCIFASQPLSLRQKLRIITEFPEKYDVSFYEDLPLHIKKEILFNGKILFTRNYDKILQQLSYVELEYPRYKAFLDEYHQEMMAAV